MARRIGGFRDIGDPGDARRRLGPRPMGSAAPGMPGFGGAADVMVLGPRPTDSVALGMPGFGPGISITPQGVGTGWRSLPLGERASWYDPDSSVNATQDQASSAVGQWLQGEEEKKYRHSPFKYTGYGQPSLLPGGRAEGVSAPYRSPDPLSGDGNQRSATIPYSQRLLSLLNGADRVVLQDPALLSGSIRKGTQTPGGVKVAVSRDDLPLSIRPQVGADPEEALNVYRGILGEGPFPGSAQGAASEDSLIEEFIGSLPLRSLLKLREKGPTRSTMSAAERLYKNFLQNRSPGQTARRAEYSDGTPVEQFPVNWSTGLPDDTPLFARGRSGADRAETRALGGTVLGSIGQDPALVSTQSRGKASGDEPETMVPYVYHKGGREFEIRYIDPTQVVENIEIDPSQRTSAHTSDSFREVTLASKIQDALNDAKIPLMPLSALEDARRRGRFLPIHREQQGSLAGYILNQGVPGSAPRNFASADDIPEADLAAKAGIWNPVYAPETRGARLTMRRDVPPERGYGNAEAIRENAYRVGGPLNRDPDRLREYLKEALGLAGVQTSKEYAIPWKLEDRNQGLTHLGRLQSGIDRGFQVLPATPGSQPIAREELAPLLQRMRGQEDDPLASGLNVVYDGKIVHRLLPERDLGGRLTGRFYTAQEQEIGPAVLIEDELLRQEAEKFAEKHGLGEGGTLDGFARAMASAGAMAPKFVPRPPANADPIAALVAKAVLSEQELAANPILAAHLDRVTGDRLPVLSRTFSEAGTPLVRVPPEIAAKGSYDAKDLLAQSVHDVTGQRVPLATIRERLQYQDRPAPVETPMDREFDHYDPIGRRWLPTSRGQIVDDARRQLEDHADLPETVSNTSWAPLQEQAAGQVLGTGDRQLGLPREGSQLTGVQFTWAPDPALDALKEYMALRARQMPARVRNVQPADQLQLLLDPAVEQLSLGPAPQLRLSPFSPEMAARISHLRTAPEVQLGAGRGPRVDQLGLPLQAGVYATANGEVRRSFDPPDRPGFRPARNVGRAAGPYAGSDYYGLGGDASPYQQPMTMAGAIGGFNYDAMAQGLGAAPGSPEHTMAMAQLASRVAARRRATAAGSQRTVTPQVEQMGFLP